MFSKDAIHATVELFSARGVMLYYACQLSQFEAYLRVGSLTSDAHLQQAGFGAEAESGGSGTASVTAPRSICLHLTDPGVPFARDLHALPALGGPIVFQLKPTALANAAELAICLKSRDAAGFDPGRHTLAAPGDVAHLFKYTAEAPLPEKSFLKSASEIRAAFNCEDAAEPRIYCTPAAGGVPFGAIASVWVDNYLIEKRQLRDWVHAIQAYYDYRFSIQRRYSPADIGGLLANGIVACLLAGVPTLTDVAREASPLLRKWAAELAEKGLEQDFETFARSFREETILPIVTGRKSLGEGADAHVNGPPPISLPRVKRELVDRLLQEKISVASIARITDLDEKLIQAYATRK
ncbi:MAG: hypothetical protein WAV08_04675 [Desulfobacterales bacterium]